MSSLDAIVLLIALGSAWAMTGLIWVIQLVHYPIFDAIEHGVDDEAWQRFAHRHTTSISFVVGPLMLAEGITGLWLVAAPPGGASRILPIIALALLGVALGVTALISAPLHGRLAPKFDPALHHRLVTTNWIRTAAWSSRAVVLTTMTFAAIT